MLYMVTFTINIPQMLTYTPYMDPMGYNLHCMVIPTTKSPLFTGNGCGFPTWRFMALGLPHVRAE
jgi:hypothetical protein